MLAFIFELVFGGNWQLYDPATDRAMQQHHAALASSSSDARDVGGAAPSAGWGQQASSAPGGRGPQIAQPLGSPSEGELAEEEPPEAQQVFERHPGRLARLRDGRSSLSRPPSWDGGGR